MMAATHRWHRLYRDEFVTRVRYWGQITCDGLTAWMKAVELPLSAPCCGAIITSESTQDA